MNKGDLINAIAARTQDSKADVEKFINAFVGVVSEHITEGEGIRIAGFGTLAVVKRKGRNGRNPLTGEKIFIESRYAPIFKAGKELREAANRLRVD